MKPMRVGVVGAGSISGIYLENIATMFPNLELAGVCDVVPGHAQAAAARYGVPAYGSLGGLLDGGRAEVILNLTRPSEHFDVSMAALKSGLHVYSEKPLAASLAQGDALAEEARARGLALCGAPDTFLGAGLQTCRKLVDDGFIGEPVGTQAFMVCRGHEGWHPDPAFYYKKGGGPLFDMGPYYLTALVSLMGPVARVSGMARASFATRLISSQPHAGEEVAVETPTYVAGTLEFVSGALGTLLMTFDAHASEAPRIEVFGAEGTLSCPDPNEFGGPVRLWRPEAGEWKEIPLLFGHASNSRGIGLSDMASAIQESRQPRTGAGLPLHVLEIMSGILQSAEEGRTVSLSRPCGKPEPF